MKKRIVIQSIFILFLLTGCSLPKLTRFSVEPFAKPFDKSPGETINIFIDKPIHDTLLAPFGPSSMKIFEFRESLGIALANTFKSNFKTINFVDKKDNGICILIFKINSYWGTGGANGNSSVGNASSPFPCKVLVKYEASLYYNGNKISNSDKEVSSELQAFYPRDMRNVFKNGVKVMCETMNKELFSDESVNKIISTK